MQSYDGHYFTFEFIHTSILASTKRKKEVEDKDLYYGYISDDKKVNIHDRLLEITPTSID